MLGAEMRRPRVPEIDNRGFELSLDRQSQRKHEKSPKRERQIGNAREDVNLSADSDCNNVTNALFDAVAGTGVPPARPPAQLGRPQRALLEAELHFVDLPRSHSTIPPPTSFT
jgi:hypothetical protein